MTSRRRAPLRIEVADAIVVGPEDYLVIRVQESLPRSVIEGFTETLREMGLGERVLIVAGDVEMAKVAKA